MRPADFHSTTRRRDESASTLEPRVYAAKWKDDDARGRQLNSFVDCNLTNAHLVAVLVVVEGQTLSTLAAIRLTISLLAQLRKSRGALRDAERNSSSRRTPLYVYVYEKCLRRSECRVYSPRFHAIRAARIMSSFVFDATSAHAQAASS